MQGKPSRLASRGGARCVTEISGDDGRVVAVVHDPALRDDPTFLDVARASVLKALELERLSAELRSSLRELSESRARIMSGADRERQRIERDLHDGAQQSLVALRIRLELAGELLRESPAGAEQLLGEARHGGRRCARAGQVARARGLSVAAVRSRARGGAALCCVAQPGSDHRRRGRHRAPQPDGRDRGLLLLPRGDSERDEARRRRRDDLRVPGRERRSPLRGARRRGRVREGRGDVERRPHQHERPARGCRRRARHPNGARHGDLCLRNGSAEPATVIDGSIAAGAACPRRGGQAARRR